MIDAGRRALPHERTRPGRAACKKFLARSLSGGDDPVENTSRWVIRQKTGQVDCVQDSGNNLAEQLYALEHNQQTYGSSSELMNDWGSGINTMGTVESGWNSTDVGSGDVHFSNVGGRPGDYDQWSQGNTMGFYVAIPTSQMTGGEFNHDLHYISASGSQVDNAFISVHDIDNMYGAPANNYVVVPEPATILLGLAGVAALARKRIGRAVETVGKSINDFVDTYRA